MWTIDNFHADINLNPNGEIGIVETIDVEFDEEKHGIFRNIPEKYRAGWKNTSIDIDIERVLMDGKIVEFDVYRESGDVVVKIGDPDVTITGDHEYQISYSVEGAILYEDSFDSLYWNVTGNDWEVPIAQASATVTVPQGSTNVECYRGSYGSTKACPTMGEAGEKMMEFAAQGPFTVLVNFSKGIIAEPTKTEVALRFLRDNVAYVFALLLAGVPPIFWFRRGNDKRLKTIIAEYEPPKDMTAGACGFLLREKFDQHVMASMLVQMANKGYLEMHIDEKKRFIGTSRTVTLRKLKNADENLDEAHRLLFEALFGHADEQGNVVLRSGARLVSKTARKMITESLGAQLELAGYYHHESFKARNFMIGLGVAAIAASYFIFQGSGWNHLSWAILPLPLGITSLIFGPFMTKKTDLGNALAEHVLGFKLFMHTAERYRSAWQENEGIFTEYLPYAIAFRDTHRWAKTFEHVNVSQPSWFVSNHAFSAAYLASGMHGFEQSLASAAQAPSSGGGGGSSGGGFGGGGGGSW